jgi:hypothetical protein
MAEKLDPKEVVDMRELLMSEVIQSEALTGESVCGPGG